MASFLAQIEDGVFLTESFRNIEKRQGGPRIGAKARGVRIKSRRMFYVVLYVGHED